jgi:hypothetical protein
MSTPLHQDDEKLKGFGGHGDRLAIAEEETLWGVQLKGPELIQRLGCSSHSHPKKKFLRFLLEIPQDFLPPKQLGFLPRPSEKTESLPGEGIIAHFRLGKNAKPTGRWKLPARELGQ